MNFKQQFIFPDTIARKVGSFCEETIFIMDIMSSSRNSKANLYCFVYKSTSWRILATQYCGMSVFILKILRFLADIYEESKTKCFQECLRALTMKAVGTGKAREISWLFTEIFGDSKVRNLVVDQKFLNVQSLVVEQYILVLVPHDWLLVLIADNTIPPCNTLKLRKE